MKIDNINRFVGGWLVGDFEPSVFRSKSCEIGVKHLKAGFVDERHYHKLSTEFNLLIEGKLIANGKAINTGDIFIYLPDEVNDVEVLQDSIILVIRNGTNPTDKYLYKAI